MRILSKNKCWWYFLPKYFNVLTNTWYSLIFQKSLNQNIINPWAAKYVKSNFFNFLHSDILIGFQLVADHPDRPFTWINFCCVILVEKVKVLFNRWIGIFSFFFIYGFFKLEGNRVILFQIRRRRVLEHRTSGYVKQWELTVWWRSTSQQWTQQIWSKCYN